jgi:tetratricopeptide (TPR) repeat protein
VYANEECIRYYRRSLDLMARLLDEPERNKRRAEIYERLGDVLELTGRNAEAWEAYQACLALLAEDQSLWRARVTGKVATTLREEADYDMALQTYLSAETMLGEVPGERDANWQKEWLDIQLNRMLMHYWLDEEDEAERLVNRARPVVEQYGSPIQQGRFFLTLGRVDFRRDRFMVSAETVERSRKGFAMMQKAGRLHEKAESSFHLAFCLLWHGDLPEAEERLLSSLRLAEQTGDTSMHSRSLTYLSVLYRKIGRVDAVREYASRSLPAAQEANIPSYIATARANQAWLAFREGELAQAEAHALAAMEIWQEERTPSPLQWVALWPLIAVALAKERLEVAVNYARALLDPSQQKLPDALTAALEQSVLLFDAGQTEASTEHLRRGIQLAGELRCF